ncbi:GNAT family N-acetyltransferase [Subtercola frigoramans]|uniref:GNAT superfamily N-acetyltransferase n=1 Tax=Subtercola frigoramans TaxID=120298 RepID=A0ABS2L015_9MICO|nr:GNAT family N-acetyltransferase [Subtercola frigoramans]MBM7470426.1 GNAT superfamily N-acetyltransferase [Subtercola frigoramans]
MSTPNIAIRSTTEADWLRVRALRLEMLADTPLAFGETLASALELDDGAWRARARRGEAPTGTALVATDENAGALWVGSMGGYLDSVGPMLVGVYVTPEYRGRAAGVTDLLLKAVEEWARSESDSLTLHVHSENPRAIAAYTKRGYRPTGQLFPYILNPHQHELEMRKQL